MASSPNGSKQLFTTAFKRIKEKHINFANIIAPMSKVLKNVRLLQIADKQMINFHSGLDCHSGGGFDIIGIGGRGASVISAAWTRTGIVTRAILAVRTFFMLSPCERVPEQENSILCAPAHRNHSQTKGKWYSGIRFFLPLVVDATDPVKAEYSLPGLFFVSFTFQSFLISLISCSAQMLVAHLCCARL